MLNNNAGMLHRAAKTVLGAVSETPPEWFEEWLAWLQGAIGTQPEEKLGNRAHENWNLVALGSLMSWNYFAERAAEDVGDDKSAGDNGDSAAGDVPGAVGVPEGGGENLPVVRPSTFAILGPDGQPLVEGYRG